MIKYLLTYFLLVITYIVNAQQYNFRSFSLKEGLSRSGVYFVLQDSKGFLWVGTEGGGVCKFDGYSFTNFTRQDGLPSENVRVVFEDSKGTLWLGTDKGLCYKEGYGFKSITTKNGLCNDFVRTIAEDHQGHLWVGTNFDISLIDIENKEVSQPKFNQPLPHHKVRTILVDSSLVWIGTDKGLCQFSNNQLTILTTADGLSNNLILNLFKDSKNNLWVGTKLGVTKISPKKTQYWTEVDGLINNRVRSISEDIYGNIWLGTKKGVSIFDGQQFVNLNTKNGLSNERIRCVTQDSFGNIWLGSYFGGIMRFNYKDFVAFTKNDSLISNQITCITEDSKGDIIVGSYEGVSKLKIRNNQLILVKHVSYQNGLLNNHVNHILKDNKGYYWYGTDIGITILKNEKTPIYINTKDGLKDDNVNIIKQIDDIFWVGTNKGVAIISPNHNYSSFDIDFKSKDDGLAGKHVSCITVDSLKRIWVGFSDGQLTVFDADSIYTPQLDSAIKEINALTFDALNRIWIGTNGHGIYYGEIPKDLSLDEKINLKNITYKDNLSSNYIFSLLYDQQSVWVGNEKGLNLIEFKTDTLFFIQDFGPERGFLGLQNNLNASFKDHHNNLWFGTVNGLYYLNNREVEQYNSGTKSMTYITKVVVDGRHSDWKGSKHAKGVTGPFNLPVDLVLPYDHNKISFEFIALNYISPKKIKFKWRLKGYDKEWSSPSSKNYMDYTNLDPGKYEFQLKSTNEKGEFTDDVVSFKFKITPPFWQSWWFIVLSFIVGLIFILEFLGWRTKQLRKKQKELEDLIDERTKEVVKQKEVLEEKQKEIELQNKELNHKNKEITDSIQYSKRIQKSILPSKEKVKKLLKNYFIFYRPKDIVSGDFFWIEQNPNNSNQIFFAAADCTGHGVPGAMVSMISTTALSSSLAEHQLTSPGEILDKTNQILIEAFTDHETGAIIKDGMDIGLGSLNYDNPNNITFEFSGAQNPAWIITPINEPDLIVNNQPLKPDLVTDTHQLFVIPATKQPIGHFDKKIPFKNYTLKVETNYRIYLFSDGFADQFGGEKGKKYKYKRFKLFLLNIQNHPIERQKLDIEQEFYNWKGDHEQLDDICVIGVSV